MQSITSSSTNEQATSNDIQYGRSTYQQSTNPFTIMDSYGETNPDEQNVSNEKGGERIAKKSTDVSFKVSIQGLDCNVRATTDGDSIIVVVKSETLRCNGSLEEVNKVRIIVVLYH